MVPAGVTARAGALGAERGLFLPSCPGGADTTALPHLLLDLQARAPPAVLGCWAEGPGTLGQLRPREWSGPVSWDPPWSLGWPAWSLSELRAHPNRGSRGSSLEVIAFAAYCHTRTGSTGCQHAGHLCWTRRSLPVAEGRSKSRQVVTATRGVGKSRVGPPAQSAGPGAQGPGQQTPWCLGTPRPPGGQGPGAVRAGLGAACWRPGPAHLSPGAAPFTAPPPASGALGRGESGTVRRCQVLGLLGWVQQPV